MSEKSRLHEPQQLPLRIGFTHRASFGNFIAAPENDVIDALSQWIDGRLSGELFYLWGPLGCGRSHLLSAACERAGLLGQSFAYLPLAHLASMTPKQVLENRENQQLVCLDDIDAVVGNGAWEEALFHCYNQIRESGHRLLISAHAPPAELKANLADLKSRLGWGLCYRLNPLDDAGKRDLLLRQATERGLSLSIEAADYLLSRCPRDTIALVSLMDRLDLAALSAKRRLTIPFLRAQLDADA